MAVATYTKTGTKATTPAKLDSAVFGVEVRNHQLLKDAYLSHLANARDNLAVTKKRGEVRGGGRKPWRQKGTGRARVGSSRNPLWTGGGVAFGPTGNENYSRKLSQRSRQQALRQALTLAAKEDKVRVIDSFDATSGKVKKTLELMAKWGASGNTLIILGKKEVLADRATRNLSNVRVISAKSLNVYDALNADTLAISKDGLAVISAWLGAESE